MRHTRRMRSFCAMSGSTPFSATARPTDEDLTGPRAAAPARRTRGTRREPKPKPVCPFCAVLLICLIDAPFQQRQDMGKCLPSLSRRLCYRRKPIAVLQVSTCRGYRASLPKGGIAARRNGEKGNGLCRVPYDDLSVSGRQTCPCGESRVTLRVTFKFLEETGVPCRELGTEARTYRACGVICWRFPRSCLTRGLPKGESL
jgi:hypothetical protein